MRDFIFLSTIAFLILTLSNALALAEKKRETFKYEGETGSFKTKDDWFQRKDKRRKQMEIEQEEQQREAMRNATVRRKAMREEAEVQMRAKPKTERIISEDEKKELRSGIRSRAVINAEIRNTKQSLRKRKGDYPGDIKKKEKKMYLNEEYL